MFQSPVIGFFMLSCIPVTWRSEDSLSTRFNKTTCCAGVSLFASEAVECRLDKTGFNSFGKLLNLACSIEPSFSQTASADFLLLFPKDSFISVYLSICGSLFCSALEGDSPASNLSSIVLGLAGASLVSPCI